MAAVRCGAAHSASRLGSTNCGALGRVLSCRANLRRPTAVAAASRKGVTVERVLRYPDGLERRFFYPVPEEPVSEERRGAREAAVTDDEEEWVTFWTPDHDELNTWNECSLAGAACHVLDADPLVEELSSRQKRPKSSNVTDLVRSSYQILAGSPWLLPRPLYVLAQQQMFSENGSLYCLQTRLEQHGAMDELAMVLHTPSLSDKLAFARLKDGVVAFDRAEDAARFATCVEAESYGAAVEVMEVQSHQLFQLTGGSDALVVYLAASDFMPMPQQLMAALKQQQQ